MSSVSRMVPDLGTVPDIEVFATDIEVLESGDTPTVLGPAVGVDAIVVGIDDTLYLKRDYVRSGFEAIGRWAQKDLGVADFGARAWAAFEAGARETVFDDVLTACGARSDDAVITALVARYRTHTPSITLAADAVAALDRWHGNVQLAAVTNGPVSSYHAKVRALGLEKWTPVVVCTADLGPGRSKSHPLAFQQVQERLGVSGKGCVFVGSDPRQDFAAPKALGWRTVRLRRRLGLTAALDSGDDVDHEITSLDQLESVLLG